MPEYGAGQFIPRVRSVAGKRGVVTIDSDDITDATTAGKAMLTAADAAAQLTLLSLATAVTAASTLAAQYRVPVAGGNDRTLAASPVSIDASGNTSGVGTLDTTGKIRTTSTTDSSSSGDTGAAISTAGGAAIAKNLFVGGDFAVAGDLEPGSVTLAFGNVATPTTFTSANSKYVKIGNLYIVYIEVTYTGLDTSDTSGISLSGLPGTRDVTVAAGINIEDSTGFTFAATDSVNVCKAGSSGLKFVDNAKTDYTYDSGKIAASGTIIMWTSYLV